MSDDRRAMLVTGAASGIGRAAARLFAERGWLATAEPERVRDARIAGRPA